MHSSQLAELGSWVATHSNNFIFGDQEQPQLVATSYWAASKIRLQRWVTALKMFEQDFKRLAENNESESQSNKHNPWPAFQIVVQEIMMSEMLTRIWSAAVLTHDWHHQSDEMHGLAHSIHIAHVEARNRAVRIMLHAQAIDESAFDQMNVLRRKIERWTDLFLGQLPNSEQAAVFAFDRNRVVDFNREQRESVGPEYNTRLRVLSASFASDMRRIQIPYAANPDLNRDVAAGILSCFPADRFDGQGMPKSTRMIRLEKSHDDTQQLVDQLHEFEKQAEIQAVLPAATR